MWPLMHTHDEPPMEAQQRVREDASRYRLPSPLAIHEALRADGDDLLGRPSSSWAWSGLAGGLSMGFSVIAAVAIHAALPRTPWSTLLVALGGTVGYLIIILGRQGLITESAMITALEVLSNPRPNTVARFAGLIGIVTLANIAGALLMALLLTWTGILDAHHKTALSGLAARTVSPSFGALFFRSLIAGWAIALAVWTAPAAGSGKIFSIFILAYLTGILHLAHLSVGSIEVMHLGFIGTVGWTEYLGRFLPAVFLGNLIGGFALAALLNHLQVRTEMPRPIGSAQPSKREGRRRQ